MRKLMGLRLVLLSGLLMVLLVACRPEATQMPIAPPTSAQGEALTPASVATETTTMPDATPMVISQATQTAMPVVVEATSAPIVNEATSLALDFSDGRPFFLYSYASW